MYSKLIFLVLLGLSSFLDSATAGNGNYNSSCYGDGSIDYDCDRSRGFYCDRETSRCLCYSQNEMDYNEKNKRCEPYLGGDCYIMDSNLQYVTLKCKDTHAKCEVTDSWYPFGKCVCKKTHLPSDDSDDVTPDKKCLPGYDMTCDTENLPCHESFGLSCTNNRCQCKHPLTQDFDKGEKMCLGMLETRNSCDSAGGGPLQCGSHAECGADGKCHCGAGWSADFSFPRKCRLHHGQECSEKGGKCNSDRGLECMGGTCQCGLAPDVAFDENKQVCAVKEGFSCSLQNAAVEVKDKRTLLACMTGLVCVPEGDHPHFGVCVDGGR